MDDVRIGALSHLRARTLFSFCTAVLYLACMTFELGIESVGCARGSGGVEGDSRDGRRGVVTKNPMGWLGFPGDAA